MLTALQREDLRRALDAHARERQEAWDEVEEVLARLYAGDLEASYQRELLAEAA
jgi:hypothetical protein